MARRYLRVERDGWFIDIEALGVAARPHWEIRCLIRRKKDGRAEKRTHRFVVSDEAAERLRLDEMKADQRGDRLMGAAKSVILRELDDIFDEPEEGLDSVRELGPAELGV
jgi:hypothetical protein